MHLIAPPRPNAFSRSLANPFAAYAAGFCLALSVYSLGYSDLYPPLRQSLMWFLLGTCSVCVVLALTIGHVIDTCVHKAESAKVNVVIMIVIMAVFAVEIVVNGGIPLLIGLSDPNFNYQDFGIPEVHVAFFGFCYFYAVYWFDLYLLEHRRVFLALSLSATSTSLLMFSRGAFIITLLALIFVYLLRRGLSRRLVLLFVSLVAVTTWGFGLLGDIRTHGASGESIILSIGQASDRFVNSNIPTEFFWPYLYVSSPLANLQLTVNNRVTPDAPATYFELEFLPDFISKRVVPDEIRVASTPILIVDALAVSTMYGRSFLLMGWLGLFLSFSYFVVISICCMRLLNGSKYLVAASAILSSLSFLNIFDNMFIFVGGILQVMIALGLHLFERPLLARHPTPQPVTT